MGVDAHAPQEVGERLTVLLGDGVHARDDEVTVRLRRAQEDVDRLLIEFGSQQQAELDRKSVV